MSSVSSSQSSIDSVSVDPSARYRSAQGYTRSQLEAWDLLPMEMLEEYHDPLVYEKPPLLHYGIGLDLHRAGNGESLVPWARERGLYVEPKREIFNPDFNLGMALAKTMDNVVKYLSKRCGYRFEHVLPWSVDYDGVIAIYNNYDLAESALNEETQANIIEVLREVVNDPNQLNFVKPSILLAAQLIIRGERAAASGVVRVRLRLRAAATRVADVPLSAAGSLRERGSVGRTEGRGWPSEGFDEDPSASV
ncbi:hypothetical protein K488DRAFT_75067 [Vararia minispora EC-137]|uniref:Uncharacterized protein n=1 Tax=Vararia minispora EC-137 TaxID=1314806 RepID=A0ACB8Q4W7_9AGAM|nr:hypothetical protein K488DRAFT_75067 [Vararia minispora EC-137]